MKMTFVQTVLCVATLASSTMMIAQDQPGSANPQHPNIYAQKLVDDTLAKHKEVIIIAFHVTPPNQTENVIIASNIGRIGKKADEDDMRTINTGKPNLEVNATGNHFEVELVLQDQAGKTIGCAGVVFN